MKKCKGDKDRKSHKEIYIGWANNLPMSSP